MLTKQELQNDLLKVCVCNGHSYVFLFYINKGENEKVYVNHRNKSLCVMVVIDEVLANHGPFT